MTNFYNKNLNWLTISKIYELELAIFISLFHNQKHPKSFYDRFVKLSDVQSYATIDNKEKQSSSDLVSNNP